jgi:hypothetical protein
MVSKNNFLITIEEKCMIKTKKCGYLPVVLFSALLSHANHAVAVDGSYPEIVGIQVEHKIIPNVLLSDLGVVGKQRDYSLYFSSDKDKSGFYFNMYDASNKLSAEKTINDFVPASGLSTKIAWKLTTSFDAKNSIPKKFEVVDRSDSSVIMFDGFMPVIQVAIDSSGEIPKLTIKNISSDESMKIKEITKFAAKDFSEIDIAAGGVSEPIDLVALFDKCDLNKANYKEQKEFRIKYVLAGDSSAEKVAKVLIDCACNNTLNELAAASQSCSGELQKEKSNVIKKDEEIAGIKVEAGTKDQEIISLKEAIELKDQEIKQAIEKQLKPNNCIEALNMLVSRKRINGNVPASYDELHDLWEESCQ